MINNKTTRELERELADLCESIQAKGESIHDGFNLNYYIQKQIDKMQA